MRLPKSSGRKFTSQEIVSSFRLAESTSWERSSPFSRSGPSTSHCHPAVPWSSARMVDPIYSRHKLSLVPYHREQLILETVPDHAICVNEHFDRVLSLNPRSRTSGTSPYLHGSARIVIYRFARRALPLLSPVIRGAPIGRNEKVDPKGI
jgi:hypothetical protein